MRTFGMLLAVATAAIAAWLLWQPNASLAPDHGVPRPLAEPAAISIIAPSAPPPGGDQVAPPRRSEVVLPPTPLARFFGRCVDAATKQPLAGCRLDLHGYSGGLQRMREYGKAVVWQDPPTVVTGADGVFEVAFDPPPPYQFTLDVTCQGRVSLRGIWENFAPGRQRDCGDIELPFGARVAGTVVDTKGRAQPGVMISLQLLSGENQRKPGSPWQQRQGGATSGANGSFVFDHPLNAGEWRPSILRLESPTMVTIEPGQAVVTLQIVLREGDATEWIDGIVLDEQDRPAVLVLHYGSQGSSQIREVTTNREGRFRLARGEDEVRDPVSFMALTADGYEPMQDARLFPWGTQGIVLRVRRGLTIEVQALDADTGLPIERYGVRCLHDGTVMARAQGKHPQGIARLEGVRRGERLFLVEPADIKQYARTSLIRLEVTDRGVPRQVVRVSRCAERTVQVVSSDGLAVAGTRVELLLPIDQRPITLDTIARDPNHIYIGGPSPQAVLAAMATTDADGRCQLRGARGATFTLRLPGPEHAPMLGPNVVLEGDVLRVEVAR